ncbi:hypothetical protein PLICRDRAFT_29879 [Plicaturopsis crispa FD-325 SS-3]|nr:hypothetical protein PLICRDRAFT_29879 [Plicaturopsis crispa FD-325 SS-3]
MPSLRRSFSSPSVRSSPYPSALSSSSSGGAVRGHGHNPRRSSGSETTGRRVLADIDWWLVVGGQRNAETEQESEEGDQNREQAQYADSPVGEVASPVVSGSEHPSTPLNWTFDAFPIPVTSQALPTPPENFPAMFAIAPRTPPRNRRGRESTSSSLESTPEAVETPLEGLRHGLRHLDLGLEDNIFPFVLPSATSTRPATRRPLGRAHTVNDLFSPQKNSDSPFADIFG